ncbi:MAG: hypothetical protein AB7F31_07160, partial [Parachlamydiales bacterium]
ARSAPLGCLDERMSPSYKTGRGWMPGERFFSKKVSKKMVAVQSSYLVHGLGSSHPPFLFSDSKEECWLWALFFGKDILAIRPSEFTSLMVHYLALPSFRQIQLLKTI